MHRPYIWIGLGTALVLVFVAAWLLLSLGWMVQSLHKEVRGRLHRELSVRGGAHIEFTPGLAIRLDDVAISNPEGMEGSFVSAPSLRVRLGLGELFSRQIDRSDFTLIEPAINLSVDGIGRTSWPRQPVGNTLPVKIVLERASASFTDERTGQRFAVADANLAVDISASGEISLAGTTILNGQLSRLEAYVKDVSRIAEGGSPASLSLSSPVLSVDFSGRLSTADALGVAGMVSFSGDDLRKALKWSGAGISGNLGLKAFRLAGALDGKARAFAVRRANLSVDDFAATGEISFDYRGPMPAFRAVLASDGLSLAQYMPAVGWSNGDWGKVPLGFAGLRGIDAVVALDTGNLVLGSYETGPARVAADLKSGRLDVKLTARAFSGASLMIDGSGPVPGISISLKDAEFSSPKDYSVLPEAAWLDGNGLLSATLEARGHTQQEMVSTLSGELQVSLAGGALKGISIPRSVAIVSREIQEGWATDEQSSTEFTTLKTDFAIADGIASIKTLKLESPSLSMSATGGIDLLRQALDLRVDPRLRTGNGGEMAGLPVAIVVQGPWGRPRIYPDVAGILTNPKAAFESLRTDGLPATADGN